MYNYKIKRKDLIYPELSYKIVGVLFDVFNNLGGGYREKYYQKAITIALKRYRLSFKEQVVFPIKFRNESIGKNYLDFLINDEVILEIKSGENFTRQNIDQVYSYLKNSKLKLGILANFTKSGVRFKRILNIK